MVSGMGWDERGWSRSAPFSLRLFRTSKSQQYSTSSTSENIFTQQHSAKGLLSHQNLRTTIRATQLLLRDFDEMFMMLMIVIYFKLAHFIDALFDTYLVQTT
jgi:hypothetical protein